MSHHTIDLANVKQIVSEIVASHDIKSVAFVGCGASSSELYPGYYFLRDSGVKTLHLPASLNYTDVINHLASYSNIQVVRVTNT